MGWARDRWPSSVLGKLRLGTLGFGLFTCLGTLNILDGDLPPEDRLVSVACTLALCTLFVVVWRAQRTWTVEPFLVAPLAVGASYGLQDGLVAVASCLGIAVALSSYGPAWTYAVRTVLLIPVIPIAVTLVGSLGRDLAWNSPSVLTEIPLPLLVSVLMRTLRSALTAQDEALAREQIVASTGRELLGLTDVEGVRDVVRRGARDLSAATPELVLVLASVSGGRLRATDAHGVPLTVNELPIDLLRVGGRSLAMTPVPAEYVTAVRIALGTFRHWYVLGLALDETSRGESVVIVGLGDRTPPSVLTLITTLGGQHALAERACRAHGELAHQAHHDDLTGLPNRALMFQELDRALGRRNPVVLMIVDLDGFKGVNDTRGHAAGDAVLIEVALRLRSALTGVGLAARLGGDEFAVLLLDGMPAEEARELAGRLWARIRDPIELPDDTGPVRIGASIGLAVAGADTDAGKLMGLADVAMYAAKTGGSGVQVFSATPAHN